MKAVKRNFMFCLMTFMFLSNLGFAQSKEYSLKDLIIISFENNPQLKANEKNIQTGMKQIDYLDKDYLPQMFFDFNISR